MKLWIGGEIQSDIADGFREARSSVEKKINSAIASNTYDLELNGWDCIAILRDDDNFKEVIKYSVKKKDMDFRLKINYQEFKNGTNHFREEMIFSMLQYSLVLLKKQGVNDLGINRLIDDVINIGKENGWLH